MEWDETRASERGQLIDRSPPTSRPPSPYLSREDDTTSRRPARREHNLLAMEDNARLAGSFGYLLLEIDDESSSMVG